MVDRVIRHREKTPLFQATGVDDAIRSTLSRRVDLPSGGYLVFDYAEAFTVIDVNTGRFVGSRSKSSGGRLEDTITANNLEAVKEVVHQLRLRDIGGIIVIDFIDMANPKNRATVEEALKTELERDRTKTYVVEISPLGLVEMTRQNVTDGPARDPRAEVPDLRGRRDRPLRALGRDRRRAEAARPRCELEARGGGVPGRARGERGRAPHRPGRVAADRDRGARQAPLLPRGQGGPAARPLQGAQAEGKLVDIAPKSPVEEGAEIRLELVEVGEHDMAAGVGKLDGLSISVADAANLVGKKVKVRVERVLNGTAYATLVQPATKKDDVPITAESEAEKPTRAPRKKKVERARSEAGGREACGRGAGHGESRSPRSPREARGRADEEAPKPKKKTRRGSRGGRNRQEEAGRGGSRRERPARSGGGG